MIVHKRL